RKGGGTILRRPAALRSSCRGPAMANAATIAAARSPTRNQRQPSAGTSVLAFDADAVELHAMIDQAIAEFLGYLLLQGLEFGIDELQDFTALHVDQVIVMRLGRGFIARAAITKVVAVENARFLEQANGPVHGGGGNLGVNFGRTLISEEHTSELQSREKHVCCL